MDTIARFFDNGFNPTNDQQVADMVALLLSFSGSDFPTNAIPFGTLPSRDVPAAVGKQGMLDRSEPMDALNQAFELAWLRRSRVELVVRSQRRAWLYSRPMDHCQYDRAGETVAVDEIADWTARDGPLTFLLVPQGTGQRIALDRDGDGYFDGDDWTRALIRQIRGLSRFGRG